MCAVVQAMFVQPVRVQVYEFEGEVEICARKNLQTIPNMEFDLIAHNGNATGNCIHVVYIYTHRPFYIRHIQHFFQSHD